MKDKSVVTMSVEKLLERKRKQIDEAQSVILPSLGRNFKNASNIETESSFRKRGTTGDKNNYSVISNNLDSLNLVVTDGIYT